MNGQFQQSDESAWAGVDGLIWPDITQKQGGGISIGLRQKRT